MNSFVVAVSALLAPVFSSSPLDLDLDNPVITFNQNGTTVFQASSGRLEVRAVPLLFIGDSATTLVQPSDAGFLSVEINAWLDASGMLTGDPSGTFRLVGAVDVDGNGTIDADGVLLEGEALAFAADNPGGTTDLYDFVFTPTGGQLAPMFNGKNIGVGMTSEQSSFMGSFAMDFSGEAKGNIGATCVGDTTPPDVVCEVIPFVDTPKCPCDIDLDGDVDAADTIAFAQLFGAGDADFNMDGTTDALDLSDFLDCTLSPPAGCALGSPPSDCCQDGNGDDIKLGAVFVQYTGQGCDATSHSQDDDKVFCAGDPMDAAQVYVVATDDEDPDDDSAVYFEGEVARGAVIPIAADSVDRDRLKSKTFVFVYADSTRSTLLQEIEFHTSCSQPLFTGDQFGSMRVVQCLDEDGNPAGGNGDAGDGTQRFSARIGIKTFDACDSDPAVDAVIMTECDVIPVKNGDIVDFICFNPADQSSGDVCEDGIDKPAALLLQYTGDDCSATSTTQDSGKFGCSGDPMDAPVVYIVVTEEDKVSDLDDADIYFEGQVALGDTFEALASNAGRDEFKSETFVYVFADSSCDVLLQSVEFHTSCSQPIRIGDQYGSIRILGVTDEDGNTAGGADGMLECGFEFIDGRLTITATTATLIVTVTDANGNVAMCDVPICEPEEPVNPDDCCADGNKPTALVLQYTGEDCSATNTMQDDSKVGCSGDPAFDPEVFIRVTDSDDPDDDGADVYFAGLVGIDELFVMSAANAGEDKFSSETHVFIYSDASLATLLQSVEFHTSCSQPLFTGDQYGSIEIIACEDPDAPETCCESDSKPVELDLLYTGMPCSSAMNFQDDGKFECTGDTMGASPVFAMATDSEDPDDTDADVYFAGTVALGEVFTMAAANAGEDKFSSASFVYFFDGSGNLLQAIEFHTSCSQPLNLGDTFGGFELVGCRTD